jgi:hypothetical protein
MPLLLGLCVLVVPYCFILSLILLKVTSPEPPHHAYKRRLPRGRKPVPAYHLRPEDVRRDKQAAA